MVLAAVVAAQEAVPTEEALGFTSPGRRDVQERAWLHKWPLELAVTLRESLPPSSESLAPSSVAQLPNP